MKIEVLTKDSGRLLVNAKYEELLASNALSSAETLWNLPSENVKKILKERGTSRAFLKDPISGGHLEVYIKRYSPLPLKEYFKSFFSFKPLFRDCAFHEWEAGLAFMAADILSPEPIAVGKASKGTFIILAGVQNYLRASELFAEFAEMRDSKPKGCLIGRIAGIAGKMHSMSFAHQDLYLLHFFVKTETDEIFIIDLQRAIMGDAFSRRWRIKDLAQLHFSSAELLTRTDMLRFWKKYCGICGDKFYRDKALISAILAKSAKIRKRNSKG